GHSHAIRIAQRAPLTLALARPPGLPPRGLAAGRLPARLPGRPQLVLARLRPRLFRRLLRDFEDGGDPVLHHPQACTPAGAAATSRDGPARRRCRRPSPARPARTAGRTWGSAPCRARASPAATA